MPDPIDLHAPYGRDAQGKALAPYGVKKDGTPAKPRGFQKGGAAYHGPPAGTLWGDKKGPGKGPCMPPNPNMAQVGSMSYVEKRARAEANALDAKLAAEEMKLILYEKAHHAEHEMTQIAAASKLLDRIEGLPTQKIVGGGEGEEPLGIAVEFVRVKET